MYNNRTVLVLPIYWFGGVTSGALEKTLDSMMSFPNWLNFPFSFQSFLHVSFSEEWTCRIVHLESRPLHKQYYFWHRTKQNGLLLRRVILLHRVLWNLRFQ